MPGPQDDQHAEKAEHDRARAADREALAEDQHREQSGPHRHHELDREHGRERQHDHGVRPAQIGEEMRAVAHEMHARACAARGAGTAQAAPPSRRAGSRARRCARTIRISNRLSTPPSWRTEIAISENDSSVPTIQATAAGTFELSRPWLLGFAQGARLDGSDGHARFLLVILGALFGVRLVFRPRLVEGGKLQAGRVDGGDLRILRHVDLEAARVEHLRHEAEVGDASPARRTRRGRAGISASIASKPCTTQWRYQSSAAA